MNRSLTHATVSLPLPRVTSPANGRGEVRRWVAVCLSFFLVVAPATADEPSIYEVGISKVDITPDYPIRLNGFGNRRKESEGVSQRIHARALAISAGEAKPMVLIAIDSLGVRIGMVDEVAARLQTSHGIPRENIALTFTHSHCTPKVNGASDNIFSTPIPAAHQEHIDVYTRELTDHIAEAARAAINNRQASRLEWASGKVRFSKNRRTPGGPVDHDLPTLFVRDAKSDQIRAVYVAYACHAVTLSFNQISGDWPGHAVESIERNIPGATALVSIGAGSDSNPIPGVQGDKVEIAKSQGAEIGAEVQRLLQTPRRPVTGAPAATLNRIDLPLNTLPTRDQLE
ncbi:MAG: neutral/alkaline non-lysosomal ceramidase N-terminal domain-containing protein, partial [Pirellulaceae bacterium]|nr:neutral/alkaline non-lysosomal ceramidase N-terminal domain-containing protein [Pirellulaceae bacterium]